MALPRAFRLSLPATMGLLLKLLKGAWPVSIVGGPGSSAMDNQRMPVVPADTEILRFDAAANIQAPPSGQVDAVGANQLLVQRRDAQASGVYENKVDLGGLDDDAGSRLGEAEWHAALNDVLAEVTATPKHVEIQGRWLGVDVPECPAEMDGIPCAVPQ